MKTLLLLLVSCITVCADVSCVYQLPTRNDSVTITLRANAYDGIHLTMLPGRIVLWHGRETIASATYAWRGGEAYSVNVIDDGCINVYWDAAQRNIMTFRTRFALGTETTVSAIGHAKVLHLTID